jgi:hypothetical protein
MRDIMAQLRPGDHAALFYRDRQEHLAAAIPYIQIGLERNERCLYIAGDHGVSTIVNAMCEAGIDVDKEVAANRLIIATPQNTYLRHGLFEPERMIQGLAHEIAHSIEIGFSAFRGAGELGWAAALPSALLNLYEYERMFDTNFSRHFIALCQYDETLFSASLKAAMLRIHPKIVARGRLFTNRHYIGPVESPHAYPQLTVEDVVAA